jgi:hypothetical protein
VIPVGCQAITHLVLGAPSLPGLPFVFVPCLCAPSFSQLRHWEHSSWNCRQRPPACAGGRVCKSVHACAVALHGLGCCALPLCVSTILQARRAFQPIWRSRAQACVTCKPEGRGWRASRPSGCPQGRTLEVPPDNDGSSRGPAPVAICESRWTVADVRRSCASSLCGGIAGPTGWRCWASWGPTSVAAIGPAGSGGPLWFSDLKLPSSVGRNSVHLEVQAGET